MQSAWRVAREEEVCFTRSTDSQTSRNVLPPFFIVIETVGIAGFNQKQFAACNSLWADACKLDRQTTSDYGPTKNNSGGKGPKMKSTLISAKLVVVLLVSALLSSCTSIPDIQPFADATANLATALNKGYGQTENQLATLEAENAALKVAANAKLTELRARWKPTKAAINALVAYTDSLAALAKAGKTGQEAANKLTDSFTGLHNAVSQLLPLPALSPVVLNAFQGIAAVNGIIAKMRARRALKEAAEDAAPAVETIAEVLAANFAELENINGAAGTAAADAVEQKYSVVLNYHKTLVANDIRIVKVLSLINAYFGVPSDHFERAQKEKLAGNNAAATAILKAIPGQQQQILEQIKPLDPQIPAGLAATDANAVSTLEDRQKELLDKSKRYREELSRIDPEYQKVMARIVSIDNGTRGGKELFTKSQEAIKAWAKAHNDLKLALEKKQGLTFRELVSIVREVIDTFDKGENK